MSVKERFQSDRMRRVNPTEVGLKVGEVELEIQHHFGSLSQKITHCASQNVIVYFLIPNGEKKELESCRYQIQRRTKSKIEGSEAAH